MMPPSHKQGIAIILGAGGPPHPMGGEEPDGDEGGPMIPVPKDFNTGNAKPGDTLTVQVECRLSDDGKNLIPLSVDGQKLGGPNKDMPSPDDQGDDVGDKWQEMFGDNR